MSRKFGDQNYDLGRFMQRGVHEISNALYPESSIPLRDHAGLYGSHESRDVEPHHERTQQIEGPDLDDPDLDL